MVPAATTNYFTALRLGLKTIDWNKGTDLRDGDYTKIVQNVLKSYGIDSSAALRYNSPQDLANAIIAAKGEPAMLNISLAGHEGAEDHSVTVQWEPSGTDQNKGMFRVNNIAGMGGSKLFIDLQKSKVKCAISHRVAHKHFINTVSFALLS